MTNRNCIKRTLKLNKILHTKLEHILEKIH